MKLIRRLSLAVILWASVREVHSVPVIPDDWKVGGFPIGSQAYAFKEFTAFEAIEKTAAAGGKTIEFFLWQPLSTNLSNVLLDENLSDQRVALLKNKLAEARIMAVSGYVSGDSFNRIGADEKQMRRVFEFAKKMGFVSLTGEPPEASLDLIEKLCKEYDILFCLHNHRREEDKPDYKYWDPSYNLNLLKNRDWRMGVCLDTGHLIRSGLKPVEALKLLKNRVLALHLKDPLSTAATEEGHDTIFGGGIGDVKSVLKELKEQNFDGYISIEYEHNLKNNVGDVRKCIDFVRAEGSQLEVEARRQSVQAVSVPNGFKYEVLVQGGIPEPVDLEFSPDGRLWFTGRRGELWAYSLKGGFKQQIARIPVPWEPTPGRESNERGLHGLAFHPDFLKNGYLYLYYSTLLNGQYSNRVSRFTVANSGQGDHLAAGSEKVLVEFTSSRGFHQGGAMEVNPRDGKLYVSVGDNNVSTDTQKFFDDPNNPPQRLDDLRGKTLRLNLDGSIPRDNPFVKTPGARPEIYTYGHRNPYSMNVDNVTGNVYVGEVGYDRRQDWEEINLLKAGGNYGWPRCMGMNLGTFGGDCPLTNAVLPWVAYIHEGGANVTSGPFYRATPGAKFTFPTPWQNGMFYADFTRKWIRFAQVDPAGNASTNTVPFARGFTGGILSMHQGPDDALYFVEYAGWFTGTPKDKLSRIVYVGEPAADQPKN